MDLHPSPLKSTSWTLVWFVALAGAWQLAPAPPAWKILPDLKDTFLVQGWKDSGQAPGPLADSTSLGPPPPPPDADEEDEPPADLAVMAARAARGPSASTAISAAGPGAPAAVPGAPPAPVVSPATSYAPRTRDAAAPGHPEASPRPSWRDSDATLTSPTAGRRGKAVPSPIAALPSPAPIEQGCLETRPDGSCARQALDAFFHSLERTIRREPGAITRVTHFGDSIIASDYISATVRRRLQRLWGDAGHGFLLAAKPWRWYDHRGVVHETSEGWLAHGVVFNRFRDRYYGLGGVAFQTSQAGLTAEYGTAQAGPMGRSVSRFDLYYQTQPGGGSVDLLVGNEVRQRLSTASDKIHSAFLPIDVPDGPSKLKVRTVGDGPVRLYGVTLERSTPGIVYDSVGIVGGSMMALRKIDPAHWIEQLRHRDPNLVVLTFGANESLNYANAGPKVMRDYEAIQSSVLREIHTALPNASVLVMGPLDAADKSGDDLITRPSIPKILAAQRRAALATGSAFWDTFSVMGGEGSMGRWVRYRLGSSDMIHPSWSAAVFLGNELTRSLVSAFQARGSDPGPAVARVPAGASGNQGSSPPDSASRALRRSSTGAPGLTAPPSATGASSQSNTGGGMTPRTTAATSASAAGSMGLPPNPASVAARGVRTAQQSEP